MKSETELAINRLRQGCPLDKVLEDAKLPELGKFLMKHVYRKNISISTLAELSYMDKSTVYRICDNKIHPLPNVLIRLSRVLKMNIEDTQRFLKCANLATLSGERKRDLVIINGIIMDKDISDINKDLIERGFPDLFTKK